jgi:succinyl-diaminopimelate desuccinylase
VDLDEFLAAAVDFLAIDSTADKPEQLRRAVDAVVEYVGPGFAVERFESGGKPSALLYAQRYEGGRPEFRIILNGHVDVVPADAAQFRPRLVGNRLYGRGAQDMKLSALVMARVFRESADSLPFPIALQIVADEEVGGRDGTLRQVRDGVTGRFVVIGEHSRLDIVADSKGLVHLRLLSSGTSAHGAYPWLGDNALLKLGDTLNALLAKYPPAIEEVWRTTVNVARIETPNRVFNQVPGYAEAWLDIRYPAQDEDLHGRTEQEIAAYLQSFCAPGVTVDIDHTDPPHHVDHDREEIRLLRRAAQEQGYRADFLYKHGAGDGRFYAARGIPSVAFGVGGAGQHGPDEYAEIDTITPYHAALSHFLRSLPTRSTGRVGQP